MGVGAGSIGRLVICAEAGVVAAVDGVVGALSIRARSPVGTLSRGELSLLSPDASNQHVVGSGDWACRELLQIAVAAVVGIASIPYPRATACGRVAECFALVQAASCEALLV